MATPRPGTRVRGSTTGQPLMALFDLLGRRWTMRILWELNVKPATFRELQERCDEMSSSVLNTRISELREVNLLELNELGYGLTSDGKQLMALIAPLRAWSKQWSKQFGE